MNVKIYPSRASGEITAPPSKSLSHRALICGALSGGSTLYNVFGGHQSGDVGATLNCLCNLGADICVHGLKVKIGNFNPFDPKTDTELDCVESGSTLRFLIPLCLLCGKRITLRGAERLFERPLGVYEDICREQGILFEKSKNSVTLCGKLKSGIYKVPGDISSQFITGLLFALPLLDGVSIIEVTGKFESASYVDLTLDTLAEFGIKVTRNGNRFVILGNQRYQSSEYTVESDCSNAAFLQALDFLGGDVTVNGISDSTHQGDRVYKDIFAAMERGERHFDLSDCPDLAPILFAVASAKGGAEFTGTARLKIKESDRAEAMATELAKFGVPVIVKENSVSVCDAELKTPTEVLDAHNDHRIVMSLAVLCTLTGGEIKDAEACGKSYRGFFDDIEKLNVKLERI
ncbi:MAG: 3-phosphoshikimate 1-carboxyvinyltransferase [Clostridia bacterium]|nr:3-phosphoshikimate 1-carboxyvinyltransferase [Clostridia bacterium]